MSSNKDALAEATRQMQQIARDLSALALRLQVPDRQGNVDLQGSYVPAPGAGGGSGGGSPAPGPGPAPSGKYCPNCGTFVRF
ncbi:hypothetical protein P3W24_10905 [Luteibacter sp. PPL201]|uniref:Uncharacterized protein n=1 Tax=Luteibacter sahnii TaxID=3021977 RepID=A0ABT6BBH0_9GAMM